MKVRLELEIDVSNAETDVLMRVLRCENETDLVPALTGIANSAIAEYLETISPDRCPFFSVGQA